MAEGAVKPGEYEIKELSITGHNGFNLGLDRVYTDFIMYEDIFSNNISATLNLITTEDLVEAIPIVGQEKVNVKIDHPGGRYEIDLQFVVHKISSYKRDSQKNVVALELVDVDYVKNMETRISEYMEGPASSIVQKLFDYIGAEKTLEIKQESEDEQQVIIPNFTPFRAINWMSEKSHFGDEANYLFYASKDGYKFTPMSKLFESEPKTKLVAGEANIGNDPNHEHHVIKSYDVVSQFDVIGGMNHGLYNSTALKVDILKRKTTELSYDIWNNYDATPHISDGSPFDVSGQGQQFMPSNRYLLPENELGVTYNHDKTNLQRRSQLSLLENMKMNVEIHGDTYIHIGDSVDLYIQVNNGSLNESRNKLLSGKWLVSAIQHRFSAGTGQYSSTLECIRDSMEKVTPTPQPVITEGSGT
jgi:hypothetical protein